MKRPGFSAAEIHCYLKLAALSVYERAVIHRDLCDLKSYRSGAGIKYQHYSETTGLTCIIKKKPCVHACEND